MSFHCDMDFDPFAYMHNNKKVYGEFIPPSRWCSPADTVVIEGFNLAVYEFMETIPSLWPTVKGYSTPDRSPSLQNPDPTLMIAEFIKQYPQYLAPDNSMEFLSDDGGAKYNGCHCK